MNVRTTRLAILAVSLLATAACLDNSITGTRTLAIEMTPTTTDAVVAVPMSANVIAMGTGLQGILMDWGDGVVDSFQLAGTAVEAERNFQHDYASVGTFLIVATAQDQFATIADSATVNVTAAPAR